MCGKQKTYSRNFVQFMPDSVRVADKGFAPQSTPGAERGLSLHGPEREYRESGGTTFRIQLEYIKDYIYY